MLQLPLATLMNSSIAIGYFKKLVSELQTCCVQLRPYYRCRRTTSVFFSVVTLFGFNFQFNLVKERNIDSNAKVETPQTATFASIHIYYYYYFLILDILIGKCKRIPTH